MRAVITRVLPVPAPASTRSGPSVVVTASRWDGLRAASRPSASGIRPGWVEDGRGGRDKGRVYITSPVVEVDRSRGRRHVRDRALDAHAARFHPPADLPHRGRPAGRAPLRPPGGRPAVPRARPAPGAALLRGARGRGARALAGCAPPG